MRSFVVMVLVLVLVLVLSGCRMPTKSVPSYSTRDNISEAVPAVDSATLGANDVIEVRVFQEPDLTGVFRISAEGTIDYPFCGRVKSAGISSSDLVAQLTKCLENGYLKRPQITVFLKEYNSKKVFVFGEVEKPGTFPYETDMTIVQAVTLAGGFTKLAAKDSVIVTRQVTSKSSSIGSEEKKIRVPVESIGEGRERNFAIQPGDIVFVPESFL